MNRRESLKKLMVASGSLITLPAWTTDWHLSDLAAYHSSFSAADQDILSSVTDTIIPAGDSIGALSVGVDKFLQKLFDHCYDQETQNNIKTQLSGLQAYAQRSYGKPFNVCDQSQREKLLNKLAVSENQAEKDFFDLIKSQTIRGFSTSREVMVNYLQYKPVPGHYYGCVDVKA
jgi:hypothetical protein